MGLAEQLKNQHASLIAVADEQETAAIEQIKERFAIIRSGINQSFGVASEEAMSKAESLGLDEEVPTHEEEPAPTLGATS